MSSERKPNSQSFDYDRYQRLRERIPRMIGIENLPPEFISRVCKDILAPRAEKWLALFNNTSALKEELANIKTAYEEQKIKPSSPRITTTLLDSQAAELIEHVGGTVLAGQTEPVMFLISYDFASGIKYAATTIIMAEDRIRGSSGFDFVDEIDNPNLPAGPVLTVDAALLLDNHSKQAADLLVQDPTGRKLIQYTVQTLEDGTSILPNFAVREFHIEGARYAQKAYGTIYPIAERINQK